MTVQQQTPFNSYVGNGVTTVFPYQFKILAAADLTVYVAGVAKVLNVDYTVVGVGVDTGGSVAFISGVPAAGAKVSIQRAMKRQRVTDYQQQGDFNTPTVNPDFDNPVLLIQDLGAQLGRTLTLPADELDTLPTLPAKADRSGRFIAFDANGLPVASAGTGNDTALRTDLADGTTPGLGSNLVAYTRTAAEIAATVVPVNRTWRSGVWWRYGAVGNNVADDTAAIRNSTKLGGSSYGYNGTYKVTSKIQVTGNLTMIGENKESTQIISAGFVGHLLEFGDGVNRANCGLLERLTIIGGAGNLSIIHIQQTDTNNPPSLWAFRDLILKNAPCPAFYITAMWDSNFENIDILSCTGTTGNPATSAALVITGTQLNSNNLYWRGLRIEQCLAGCIYIGDAAPISIVTGKIDQGFNAAQTQAAITLANGFSNGKFPSQLSLNDFSIVGVSGQYCIDTAGSLLLGDVTILGGNNKSAAINDRRAWFHMDPTTWTGTNQIGPMIPYCDLGSAKFGAMLPFSGGVTPAAVSSKIPGIRQVAGPVTVSANGAVVGNTIVVGTSLAAAANNLYDGCYLVHNSTGTQAGSRRKIISSLSNGNLTIAGTAACVLDSDYSVEYCGQHSTPLKADGITLANGMRLFAVISSGITISAVAGYNAGAGAKYGTTTFTTSLPANNDVTGYFLVDEITGEPYLIQYGSDGVSVIGVMYDRTAALDTSHSYSLVGGYSANVKQIGQSYVWEFGGVQHTALVTNADANGFDINNIPLWDFAATGKPITQVYSASITFDMSRGQSFVLTPTNGVGFTMNTPLNASPGDRLRLRIVNTTGGGLGAITFSGVFKSTAWVQPATGNFRCVEWEFNGTNWIESYRSAADIPN